MADNNTEQLTRNNELSVSTEELKTMAEGDFEADIVDDLMDSVSLAEDIIDEEVENGIIEQELAEEIKRQQIETAKSVVTFMSEPNHDISDESFDKELETSVQMFDKNNEELFNQAMADMKKITEQGKSLPTAEKYLREGKKLDALIKRNHLLEAFRLGRLHGKEFALKFYKRMDKFFNEDFLFTSSRCKINKEIRNYEYEITQLQEKAYNTFNKSLSNAHNRIALLEKQNQKIMKENQMLPVDKQMALIAIDKDHLSKYFSKTERKQLEKIQQKINKLSNYIEQDKEILSNKDEKDLAFEKKLEKIERDIRFSQKYLKDKDAIVRPSKYTKEKNKDKTSSEDVKEDKKEDKKEEKKEKPDREDPKTETAKEGKNEEPKREPVEDSKSDSKAKMSKDDKIQHLMDIAKKEIGSNKLVSYTKFIDVIKRESENLGLEEGKDFKTLDIYKAGKALVSTNKEQEQATETPTNEKKEILFTVNQNLKIEPKDKSQIYIIKEMLIKEPETACDHVSKICQNEIKECISNILNRSKASGISKEEIAENTLKQIKKTESRINHFAKDIGVNFDGKDLKLNNDLLQKTAESLGKESELRLFDILSSKEFASVVKVEEHAATIINGIEYGLATKVSAGNSVEASNEKGEQALPSTVIAFENPNTTLTFTLEDGVLKARDDEFNLLNKKQVMDLLKSKGEDAINKVYANYPEIKAYADKKENKNVEKDEKNSDKER